MTINDRIKYIRKEKGMSQKQLSEHLGLTQGGVSYLEQPSSAVSDQTIKTLCIVFGVREDWLRDGTGEIFQEEETFSLDQFVQEHGGTELELKILKTYFELDPAIRRAVLDHFRNAFGKTAEQQKNSPSTEQLEEEYKKSVLDGASTTAATASNTTSDTVDAVNE